MSMPAKSAAVVVGVVVCLIFLLVPLLDIQPRGVKVTGAGEAPCHRDMVALQGRLVSVMEALQASQQANSNINARSADAPAIAPATAAVTAPQSLPAGGKCDDHLSATVDCATGRPRRFAVTPCRKAFTVAELLPDFMAHQVEWNLFGKTHAFYSVLTGFPADAEVTDAATAQFYATGKADIEKTAKELATHWPGYKMEGDVLDFGCGLGRLGIALAQLPDVRRVACVEQSTFHVLKTKHFTRNLTRVGNFMPMVSGPDLLMALEQDPQLPKCFDFINSVIVLQHMIMPLMVTYMEQLCDVLRPDGRMYLQVPLLTPFPKVCTPSEREASQHAGGMQMHYIPADMISELFEWRGCDVDVVDRHA